MDNIIITLKIQMLRRDEQQWEKDLNFENHKKEGEKKLGAKKKAVGRFSICGHPVASSRTIIK